MTRSGVVVNYAYIPNRLLVFDIEYKQGWYLSLTAYLR
jgi:hypothetical protein